MHRKLVEAVARLAEPYRQTVLLRYFEELSSAEIGERLGIPAATARGRLKTALDLLREDLDRAPGGRKAWVGAMVLLAGGGGPLGLDAAAAAAGRVAQGQSLLTVKVLVALVAAGGAATAVHRLRAPSAPAPPALARATAPVPPRFAGTVAPPASVTTELPATDAAAGPAARSPGAAPGPGVPLFSFSGTVQTMDPPPRRGARVLDPSCPDTSDEEAIRMMGGGLAHAVVRVIGNTPPAPPPTAPVSIEQRYCKFHPRVVVAQAGQTVQLRSADQALHRIEARSGGATVGGGPLALGTPPLEVTAPRAGETLRLACDTHTWMKAFVVATDNPWFAVTDRGGRYRVGGLPAGIYTVEVWHERYPARQISVRVGPGLAAEGVDVVLGEHAASPPGHPCDFLLGGDSVTRACREGGVARAKGVMKTMVKLAKGAGVKFECDDCHADESAGKWRLRDGAAERWKRLLAAAREARDSPPAH
jgi:plastocyanin